MTHEAISLEQREQDFDAAIEAAEAHAEQYVLARASGHDATEANRRLEEALRVARAAERRLVKTRKRLES